MVKNKHKSIKENPVLSLVIFVIIVGGGIIYYNYDMAQKDKIVEHMRLEFPAPRLEHEVVGVITKIYNPDLSLFRLDSSFVRLEINNSQKIRINTLYELEKKIPIRRHLQIGDSLIKYPDSDTVIIVSGGRNSKIKYYFRLYNDRGYPLNPGL